MDAQALLATTKDSKPPDGLSPALEALWYEAHGDWKRAHEIVQDENSKECAWVHAYLHRVEGDEGNAAYWYRIARKPIASGNLVDEWHAIAHALAI